jgi:hypothetical protein
VLKDSYFNTVLRLKRTFKVHTSQARTKFLLHKRTNFKPFIKGKQLIIGESIRGEPIIVTSGGFKL